MLRDKVTEFFVKLDDFHKEFTSQLENRPKLQDSTVKRRNRKGKLSDSEMMSIYLLFHFGQFTNFKHFYQQYVCKHLEDLFPDLVSYERFNARQERIMLSLMLYLKYRGWANQGASIILIPHCCAYAISKEKSRIGYSRISQKKENPRWAGSLVSSSI